MFKYFAMACVEKQRKKQQKKWSGGKSGEIHIGSV